MRQSLSGSITLPSSDIHYWVANYQFVKYVPLGKHFTLSFFEGIDYGQPFGDTTAIPPFRQFFGGGPDSVRGFRESRLGPKDQFGNPFGGNLRITSQNELIFPMPAKWAQTARVSAFFDIGNVYETGNFYKFYGPYGVTPQSYKLGRLRQPQALGRRRRAVAGAAGPVPVQLRCRAECHEVRPHRRPVGRPDRRLPVLGGQRVLAPGGGCGAKKRAAGGISTRY